MPKKEVTLIPLPLPEHEENLTGGQFEITMTQGSIAERKSVVAMALHDLKNERTYS